ncbi:1188_t:CDS:2, partial [Scutellospora calospora]
QASSNATITSRNSHSAVLTKDGNIIIFGGNSANDINHDFIITAIPNLAILNTNVSPYHWSVPNIPSTNAPPSLCYHSAALYNNIMIITFGVQTSTKTANNNLYLFDVQNYVWISSSTNSSSQRISGHIIGIVV